jgi:hypothetical protein
VALVFGAELLHRWPSGWLCGGGSIAWGTGGSTARRRPF